MGHARNTGVLTALVLLSSIAVAEEAMTAVPWQDTLRQAAFVKEGLGRLYNNPADTQPDADSRHNSSTALSGLLLR